MIRDLIPGVKEFSGYGLGSGSGHDPGNGQGYGFFFSVGKFRGDGSGAGAALNAKLLYSDNYRAGVVLAELKTI